MTMLQSLPEQLQDMRSELSKMIAFLEEKIPYASVMAVQETGHALMVDSRNDQISEKTPRRGIVFTLFNGRYFQEWATDCLDVKFLWQKVREMRNRIEIPESPRFQIIPGDPADAHYVSEFRIDPDDVPLTEMVDACHELMKTVSQRDRHIVNTRVIYNDGKEHKIFVNRLRTLSSSLTICSIVLVVIGQKNGSTQMNFLGTGGVTGFEAIRFRDAQISELVDDLNHLFESQPLDPGVYDVVSSPEVSGILAHEAFGHGVEMDMVVKGRAKAAEFLGQQVASPLVDMVDDPSLPGHMGSYFFDDEGVIAHPTVIIEKGILQRGLTDLRSAIELNLPRSANGRRESFERKVYTRMSNTFFAGGTATRDEIIGSVEKGVYLKKSSSGMEDPKGWGIQVGINLAREIRTGRLTGKIFAPMTITGYVPDLLQSITMVGNDMELTGVGGMCGKGHKEMVRVSAGGPHLRFKARLG